MNWEALGAIGEIVGAVAVVFTIIYLSIQIRQNTKSLAGTTLNAVTQNQQYELRWSSDINEAVLKAVHSPESMTPNEIFQVSEWTTAAMNARQNEYFQFKHGLLLPETWEAYKKIIPMMLGSKWFRNWWETYGKIALTEEFATVVDEILKDNEFELEVALDKMKVDDA